MRVLVALLMLAEATAAQAPLPCRGNLSEIQLVKLIVGKVPEPRLLQFVNQCGIGFVWNDRVRLQLSRAGATAAVLSAIKLHAKPASAAHVTAPPENHPTQSTTAPGSLRTNPKDGLRYVWIPPGTFTMGCSPGDDACDNDEKPPQSVRITNGFWLGQTEVTQAAWRKVMQTDPSSFKGDQLPVEHVDWNQAANYCGAVGGRLPAEKEWEYAARAGTTSATYGPLDAVAWFAGNSGLKTHPVGIKQPNAFGLYDMLGNVWEWTSDDYGTSGGKVIRGGSWDFISGGARVSVRGGGGPANRSGDMGFRCAGKFR